MSDLATDNPEIFALLEARYGDRPSPTPGNLMPDSSSEQLSQLPEEEDVEEVPEGVEPTEPTPTEPSELTLAPAPDPELAQLRDLQTRLSSDPGLRDAISRYMSGEQTPTAPTLPSTPATQNPALSNFPNLPQLSQDDLDMADPVSRYALLQMEQMREELAETRRQAQFAATQVSQARQHEAYAAANSAKSAFMAQTGYPADYLPAIEQAAVNSGAMITYMRNGIDPLTGLPVTPDAYQATLSALTIGSRMVPEVIEYEKTRAIAEHEARRSADLTRKAKLGGVSGSTGAPRSIPSAPPSTPYERKQAAVREIAAAMSGES